MKKQDSLLAAIYAYITDHIKGIVLFCLMLLIFILVLFLYGIALEPIFYATLLNCSLALVLTGLHFLFYYRRHRQLVRLRNTISISLAELPPPGKQIEKDYQELLRLLYAENSQLELTKSKTVSEMVDYYTLWAHQIKVPIAAMRLLIQSDETANPALAAELFKIEQYVEMALCYMRLNNQHGDYLLQSADLDKIIRQAVRKYSRLFIHKDLAVEYEGLSAKVLTDEKWLLFVIEQLLSNAVKYTNSGRVKIYMPNEQSLVIEDSGIGIPKSDLPRIFEKGFTGFNGRTDKRATGLGLYLCQRIIKNLGHTIEVSSSLGQGTRVSITFIEPKLAID